MPSSDTQFKNGEQPRYKSLPVRCEDCGISMMRATHRKHPRCRKCHNRVYQKQDYRRRKRNVLEARRYRIVLHVLGWEDSQFHEMIQEMKRCPMNFRKRPESMLARRDFRREKLYSGGRAEETA